MIISKDLKNTSFEYDEAQKTFSITNTKDGGTVSLNKVESFAFVRFLIRISQRNWLKKTPSAKNPKTKEDWHINPEQLEILITEDE